DMISSPTVSLPAALALVASAALAVPHAAAQGTPPPSLAGTLSLQEAAATITPADVYSRIEFLASDFLRGRNTPSPELEIAASYLVNQHRLFGLQPGGENRSYYQWYPYPMRRLSAAGARLEIAGRGAPQTLRYGRDFFALGGTAQPIASAALVYAGRGADEALAEGSMRGRVVVVSLPGASSRDWRRERARQRTAAQRAGAAAVVHLLDPSWTADSVARYAAPATRGGRTLGGEIAFPQFMITHEAATRMFAGAGTPLATLAARGAAARFRPAPLAGVTATLALPQEEMDRARAPNVIAILPGSDPVLRNEYVVLSAHMDHVGVGQPVNGDSIYNGADDDASGTTGLLEVAQALSMMRDRPRRSIAFVHVSGEEKGLLGSEWFSEHPTIPLAQIVANINVDMIGRNNPDSVVVIGKDYSSLGALADRVQAAHPELRLTLSDDLWPEEQFFFRSDHYNFARKEIPSIFFFSGVHADYHRPSDHVEKIDADKATRISRMVLYLVNEIANAPERPRWDPKGLEEVRGMTR
ncbi:MAG TPA: M20/M25/M40 family metallo-hydrolase, partial [Longimicrobium sp.]|nr:M20/M25/M40 family metallo-hydrolase [Longimicrobium sp.]